MKVGSKNINPFVTGLLTAFITACINQTKPTTDKFEKSNFEDTINHGYNELANHDNKKYFTISDFNTDNQEIKNIERPSVSTISTNLDTALLFGIWTNDPSGPHADFWLTSKSFLVVDYDGDGDMPYELTDNNLKIYYNDFIQEGKIISVDKDTLKIMWEDNENISYYVRWIQ